MISDGNKVKAVSDLPKELYGKMKCGIVKNETKQNWH